MFSCCNSITLLIVGTYSKSKRKHSPTSGSTKRIKQRKVSRNPKFFALAAILFLAITTLGVALIIPKHQNLNSQASTTGSFALLSPGLTQVIKYTGQKYFYAPAAIQSGTSTYMWVCQNPTAGVIRDDIYYYQLSNNTTVTSKIALQGSGTGWDSYHNCDPSVVKGTFKYSGTTYSYALFYTGNNVNASSNNQVGVAFSKSLAGPWVKYPKPIVPYLQANDWGAGQPSVTSIDGKGQLMLFYTIGSTADTYTAFRKVDLSNMTTPVIGSEMRVTNSGLTNAQGQPDILHNADFVYNPTEDRFYAIHEVAGATDYPNYISSLFEVVSIDGASIWSGTGQWKVETQINSQLSKYPRNHNGGFLRNDAGALINQNTLGIYFTVSCSATSSPTTCYQFPQAEWSYRVWKVQAQR